MEKKDMVLWQNVWVEIFYPAKPHLISGHIVVRPKTFFSSASELSKRQLSELMQIHAVVEQACYDVLGADSVNWHMNGSNWSALRFVKQQLADKIVRRKHPEIIEALKEFLAKRGRRKLSADTIRIIRSLGWKPHVYTHFYIRTWGEIDQAFGSSLHFRDEGPWLRKVPLPEKRKLQELKKYFRRNLRQYR